MPYFSHNPAKQKYSNREITDFDELVSNRLWYFGIMYTELGKLQNTTRTLLLIYVKIEIQVFTHTGMTPVHNIVIAHQMIIKPHFSLA